MERIARTSLLRPLNSRPALARVFVAVVVPAAFGGVCGWVLGVSEPLYVVLSVVSVVGGVAAGMEHDGAPAGAVRGLLGGALFGTFLLGVHTVTGKEAGALLPNPEALLPLLTTAFGAAFGAIGGCWQRRYGRSGVAAAPDTLFP